MRRVIFGKNELPIFEAVFDTTKMGAGSTNSNMLRIPIKSTNLSPSIIEWGDGTSSQIFTQNDAQLTHTYATSGVYTVKIRSKSFTPSFDSANAGHDRVKLLKIIKFGSGILLDQNVFRNCINLVLTDVEDIPEKIDTNISGLFFGCASITTVANIDQWKTSNVTNMSSMFSGCTNFNQPLNFNTSNVTNMSSMFAHARKFNQSLNFNTSNVTNMGFMFNTTVLFNQDISALDVSKVVDMGYMFNNAYAFVKDISSWSFNKNVGLSNFLAIRNIAYPVVCYDNLLQKWASSFIGVGRTSSKTTVVANSKYSSVGKPYRDALIADGWSITDSGMI